METYKQYGTNLFFAKYMWRMIVVADPDAAGIWNENFQLWAEFDFNSS